MFHFGLILKATRNVNLKTLLQEILFVYSFLVFFFVKSRLSSHEIFCYGKQKKNRNKKVNLLIFYDYFVRLNRISESDKDGDSRRIFGIGFDYLISAKRFVLNERLPE